jgi:protein-S-isoprenylcysteine O-methyltransferase Ste14
MGADLFDALVWATLVLWAVAEAVVEIRHVRSAKVETATRNVVRSGPYRVLRHPSYTGGLLAAVCLTLAWANIASVLAFMVVVTVGICRRIRVEEAVLSRELGRAYTDYAVGTARLVPGLW